MRPLHAQGKERSRLGTRPIPDEVTLEPEETLGATHVLRTLGAVAVLAVGVVHLEQYFGNNYSSISVIGPLFILNFAGALVIGLGLLASYHRLRPLRGLLALGGIGLAATSFVFLFISESRTLFGFKEHGYRPAIVISLVAEALAVALLGAYLAARRRA